MLGRSTINTGYRQHLISLSVAGLFYPGLNAGGLKGTEEFVSQAAMGLGVCDAIIQF